MVIVAALPAASEPARDKLAATIAPADVPKPVPAPRRAEAGPENKARSLKAIPPAKELFGAAKSAAPLAARAIGFYSKGCLAGARPLAVDGPAWQAMRLSRNRNWGHPRLIELVERFAGEVRGKDGWNGLLVGDLAQPRGGPMVSGHASHQIGLDADIWLTPMPDRRLTREERENISATSMLSANPGLVDAKLWAPAHARILKRAASYPQVERVLVHPAIKKALCEGAGTDRGWLRKVRPIWGHHYHFHIRIGCPKGSSGCRGQPAPSGGDGCGKDLDDWIKLVTAPPSRAPSKPSKPKPPITLDQLPAACRLILKAPDILAGEEQSGAPVQAATRPN